LFGFDVVVETDTLRHYIIDVNYFPGKEKKDIFSLNQLHSFVRVILGYRGVHHLKDDFLKLFRSKAMF
jgi:hypothetical protein